LPPRTPGLLGKTGRASHEVSQPHGNSARATKRLFLGFRL
jgi:hypothetical protein